MRQASICFDYAAQVYKCRLSNDHGPSVTCKHSTLKMLLEKKYCCVTVTHSSDGPPFVTISDFEENWMSVVSRFDADAKKISRVNMIELNALFDQMRNTADGDGACNSTCPPATKSKNVFPELMLLYGVSLPIKIMKWDGDETIYVQPTRYTCERADNSAEWIRLVEQFNKMEMDLELQWNRLRDL